MLWIYVLAITEEAIISSLPSPLEVITEYEESPPGNYTVQVIDPSRSLITIKVDPCRDDVEDCCEAVNEAMCQDNLVVETGPNLAVAWAYNNYVIFCSGIFEGTEECGTYLEIHRNSDSEVLSETAVSALYSSGFHMESVFTRSLLPGEYEIWWVERGRTGRILQSVKPFFLI